MPTVSSATNLADLTGTSLAATQRWGENGVYPYHKDERGKEGFYMEELTDMEPVPSQATSIVFSESVNGEHGEPHCFPRCRGISSLKKRNSY